MNGDANANSKLYNYKLELLIIQSEKDNIKQSEEYVFGGMLKKGGGERGNNPLKCRCTWHGSAEAPAGPSKSAQDNQIFKKSEDCNRFSQADWHKCKYSMFCSHMELWVPIA